MNAPVGEVMEILATSNNGTIYNKRIAIISA
jgi:hypothetical protein